MFEAVANRVIRFRLLPENPERANLLARLAGASRFARNAAIAARKDALRKAGWDDAKDNRKETRPKFEKMVDDSLLAPKGRDSLCAWFKRLREETRDQNGEQWLMSLNFESVREAAAELAKDYRNAAKGVRNFPNPKRRGDTGEGFWIQPDRRKNAPKDIRIADGAIRIPQARGAKPLLMKIRRRGNSPYEKLRADGKARIKRARVVRENRKWFVCLWYEIGEEAMREAVENGILPRPAENGAVVGIDRNCGQSALSAPVADWRGKASDIRALPADEIRRLDIRRKRYQRRMQRKRAAALRAVGCNQKTASDDEIRAAEIKLIRGHKAKLEARRERGESISKREIRWGGSKYGIRYARLQAKFAKAAARIANLRADWAHQTSRDIARACEYAALEKLRTPNMTRKGGGTKENPGKRVAQKRGLNRSILNSGWGALARCLEYKTGGIAEVDPAYTSKQCSACGTVNKRLKRGQRQWKCAECGAEHHRDRNAAINIERRALANPKNFKCGAAKSARAVIGPGTGPSMRDEGNGARPATAAGNAAARPGRLRPGERVQEHP